MFTFTLQYSEAMKIAKKIAHSMSTEETRYYLNGFFVCQQDGKYYAVSTDGHRLTRIRVEPQNIEGDFQSIIFPSVAVKQIENLKVETNRRNKAIIRFAIDGLSYRIEYGDQIIGGKLVEGTYPDFNRVIPEWSVYTNEYGNEGFNAKYIADIMKAASYDANLLKSRGVAVRMHFQSSSPAVFLEDDNSVLYVLMPMRSGFAAHKHPKAERAMAA